MSPCTRVTPHNVVAAWERKSSNVFSGMRMLLADEAEGLFVLPAVPVELDEGLAQALLEDLGEDRRPRRPAPPAHVQLVGDVGHHARSSPW